MIQFSENPSAPKLKNRENISMFSTCSELTPSAPIPDGRMEQIMQPCGQPLINQILNWINFCRNSNFELNRNGYRLGLPPDKHHRSQHYDVTEKFLAVAIVLNCIKWYWFLDRSNRRSEFISTTRGHRWSQKAEASTKWDIVIIIEGEREEICLISRSSTLHCESTS